MKIPSEFEKKCLTKDTLVIFDEADYTFLDYRLKLPYGEGMVIGLTATAFANENGLEAKVLRDVLGFSIHDSMLKTKAINREPSQMTLENFISARDFEKPN